VLLADCPNAAAVESLHLVPIRGFERPENRDVAGLELMRRVGWQPAENYVILKAKLKHFERFMRPKAIVCKYSRFLISERFGFEVGDELEPL
jgi:hypothetical protein